MAFYIIGMMMKTSSEYEDMAELIESISKDTWAETVCNPIYWAWRELQKRIQHYKTE
jgi:hypothetical protein